MIKTCMLAFQFFTRVPTRQYPEVRPEEMGRAFACAPVVGAFIGLVLWGVHTMLVGTVEPAVEAVLLLMVWALSTGMLHLDGLADLADGWLGGHGDPERARQIMKDSRVGTAGVVSLVAVLLLKWLLLWQLLEANLIWLLFLAPVAGRIAALAMMATTRYVSEAGLAEGMDKWLSKPVTLIWVAWLVFGIGIGFGITPLVLLLAVWLWLRWVSQQVTGGMTGDSAGAMVEVMEVAVLLVMGAVV